MSSRVILIFLYCVCALLSLYTVTIVLVSVYLWINSLRNMGLKNEDFNWYVWAVFVVVVNYFLELV